MVWRQVTECANIEPHDWTLCAFAHVGEKARRRGTAVYKYVATACPDFRKVCSTRNVFFSCVWLASFMVSRLCWGCSNRYTFI